MTEYENDRLRGKLYTIWLKPDGYDLADRTLEEVVRELIDIVDDLLIAVREEK